MNKKDFLKLEEEVKNERKEKKRITYKNRLRKLEKEEEVLLSASTLKQRYRLIYCVYHSEKNLVVTLFGACLFMGILILREVFHTIFDWRFRLLTMGVIIAVSIICPINAALGPSGVRLSFTKEGLYERLVDIQTEKKILNQQLDELKSMDNEPAIREQKKDKV